MTTIVTRAGKGSSLTWDEADANFTNLQTAIDDHIAGDWVSVKAYGAVGDGVTNDTAAMQLAHNTGKLIYYPAGTYKFTTITMVSGGIIGDGQTETILESTNTGTENLITCTGASVGGPANGLTFQDFQIQGTLSGPNPAKASGAGIAIAPVANENSYSFFKNVTISYVPTGIDLVRASYVCIMGCRFLAYDLEGVKVANANNNDSGDSAIIGCTFSCPYTDVAIAGIRHLSSGGLRINANKFLGGGYGYKMDYTDSDGVGTVTGIVQITNNSIENFYSAAIAFTRVSAGLTSFKNIVISNNEIDVALASPTAYLITTDSNAFLQNMTITGNVMQLPGVTTSSGIDIVGVTCLNISGNTFRGNGGTSTAIVLTSCVDAKIGNNTYSNITTPYSLVTPGANNSVLLDSQSGSVSTVNSGWSTTHSVHISPIVTVTFDEPFAVTPVNTDVSFTPALGDGTLGAVVTGISKTQLSIAAISATLNYTATIYWKVAGVL